MCKKESLRLILTVLLAVLLSVSGLPVIAAEALNSDPNQPVIEESADDVEMFDNDWPEDFNVEDVRIVLNFQDALVSDVLDYLSREAGLVIISDSYVSGRINLISKRPLKIDEVVALINSVLAEKGYAAIRTERTLKLVPLSEARSSNLPVITVNRLEDIQEGDDVITAIIPIRYANAGLLQQDIEPLLSTYAVVASNDASNSLIITDTKSNIKRLVRIVKGVDTQMSEVADVRVFLLEYADADSTAELINDVFEQQNNARSSGRQSNVMQQMMGGRGGRGGGGMPTMSTESSGAAMNVPVVASSDDRTNAVVVSGPSDVLDVIAQVIKELDSNPNEDHELFVYKLKYSQAADIAERLNNLFQELESINQQNTRTGGRMGGTTTRGAASSSSVTDEVYMEADESTNSLIIMTSTKNYQKIVEIIKKLDIPIPQVLIKVLLAELTTNDATDVGFEWSVINMRNNGDQFTNEFSYTPTPQEGFVSDIISGDLTATLRLLQEMGDLNILSRPSILTSNNETATINVGQEFPFITDSTRTDTNNVVNTVEYRQIGISLEVTPTINSEGLVIMDVNPAITTAAAETVRISEDFDATVFNSRTATARVAVPHGSTIVIGGLMQDSETENVEKVPLMGDLPLVGGLFKRTVTSKDKTELLIFLTPQVASDMEELKMLSNHEQGLSEFINDSSTKANSEAIRGHLKNIQSVYERPEHED